MYFAKQDANRRRSRLRGGGGAACEGPRPGWALRWGRHPPRRPEELGLCQELGATLVLMGNGVRLPALGAPKRGSLQDAPRRVEEGRDVHPAWHPVSWGTPPCGGAPSTQGQRTEEEGGRI